MQFPAGFTQKYEICVYYSDKCTPWQDIIGHIQHFCRLAQPGKENGDICVDCALDQGHHCPDCYECYLNDLFIEFETLSPLKVVNPGEVSQHTEVFSLYKKPFDFDEKSEASIDNFLDNISI